MKLKALIADDEPLARERLKFLLSSDADVEIAGECRNGREVISALREREVDVLFLDIQMPGRGGFEIIEEVGAMRMPVTVFVTAHHEHALRAFEVRALDYLTKPVEPERLRATVARVREQIRSRAALLTHDQFATLFDDLRNASPRKEYAKRLLIQDGAKSSFVQVDEIDWIEAADYYVCIHTSARNFMMRETVKQLVDSLDPEKFVRVHRSVIVNVARVREIFREGPTEGSVVLITGQRLKMSKSGWRRLLAIART